MEPETKRKKKDNGIQNDSEVANPSIVKKLMMQSDSQMQ